MVRDRHPAPPGLTSPQIPGSGVSRPGGSSLVAILGPTNTGKTRLAIDRMLGHSTGMIGLPLRLLAREVYDRVVEAKGKRAAALITGEERIAPDTARYFVCTTEAMPFAADGRDARADAGRVEFLALDEIQLARDPDRGHVFTERLLAARGRAETMWLGAESMRPLVRALFPGAAIDRRERFSKLSYAGPMKLTRLPKRSAIVAFSAEEVYAIAELIRRHRGGAAVVMGALSPRTRNAQVALYQNGEVDFLIATDAIGMGLNMDVDHVAFASLVKFDGTRRRRLSAEETAQIAGRAGRFRNDGTFGETGDCRVFEQELVARVESHEFEPAGHLEWRNPALDFSSVQALIDSLDQRPPHGLFWRASPASDEMALRALAEDHELCALARGPAMTRRLWAAAQLPDFRKSGPEHHFRLVRAIAGPLLTPPLRISNAWVMAQILPLDRMDGELDALQARLAFIRTWAYVANRGDWAEDPETLRARTRDIEDRLSDALHERLALRFVDRRTASLLRSLKRVDTLAADVDPDGRVQVDGHFVGRLTGLSFTVDAAGPGLEERALRNAAERALRPELHRRLGAIAEAAHSGFRMTRDGRIMFAGVGIAILRAGRQTLIPRVELIGGDLASDPACERAKARIETFVLTEIEHHLAPLLALKRAVASGAHEHHLTALARGLAFQLFAAHGFIARRALTIDPARLSQNEKRALQALGLRFGVAHVFLPALFRPEKLALLGLLLALAAGQRPAGEGGGVDTPRAALALSILASSGPPGSGAPSPGPGPPGFWLRLGSRWVRGDVYERLARLVRDKARKAGAAGFTADPHWPGIIGARPSEQAEILRGLGYVPLTPAVTGSPPASGPPDAPPAEHSPQEMLWRFGRARNDQARKKPRAALKEAAASAAAAVPLTGPAGRSPFAESLAGLVQVAAPPRQKSRARKRRVVPGHRSPA